MRVEATQTSPVRENAQVILQELIFRSAMLSYFNSRQ